MNKGFEILKERRSQLLKIVLREGSEYYLLDTKIYNGSGTEVDTLENSYNIDLKDKEDGCYDIVKIFRCDGTLLWERPREMHELTSLEKELLKYFLNGYSYIARDSDNDLYIYSNKPTKSVEYWGNTDYAKKLYIFQDDLFKFIKWEDDEPYSIIELLEG